MVKDRGYIPTMLSFPNATYHMDLCFHSLLRANDYEYAKEIEEEIVIDMKPLIVYHAYLHWNFFL